MNILDQIAKALAAATPILALLVGTGVVYKYAPFLSKLPNLLIPFLNALIAFIAVFGPAPANAGIIGDIGAQLGLGAKLAGSMFLSVVASQVYEAFLRHPLEKLGIRKA